MALNLWKLGGQVTAYNPLATFGVGIPLKIGEYVLTFKAKSPTGASIRVNTSNNSFNTIYNLTSEFTVIKAEIKNTTEQTLFIDDVPNVGNIIIDSIQLVQKPLPKLTINGIDGFNSGKWVLHANAKVIDDETIELNVTSPSQRSGIAINVIPNQVYTFSHNSDLISGVYFIIRDTNAAGALLYNTSMVKSVTVTAPSSGIMWISTQNDLATGNFTFKRPMLNLGTIPAPYSKKTGDKMVLPVAKKNVMSVEYPIDFVSHDAYYDKHVMTIKPNANYTYSAEINGDAMMYVLVGGSQIYNAYTSTSGRKSLSFVTDSSGLINIMVLKVGQNRVGVTANTTPKNMQVEEGTTATAYTPYAVQVNPKPKRYVPKKNLFDGVLENGDIDQSTGNNITHATRTRSANFISAKTLTNYIFPNPVRLACYNSAKVFLGVATFTTPYFTTLANTAFIKFVVTTSGLSEQIQLEEGTQQTAYEAYQTIIPRAKSGLSFNGTTDYLQLPSMTMDSVEIDCLIDSKNSGWETLFDARTGSTKVVELSGGNIVPTGLTVSGFVKNQRTKILIKSDTPFTDNVTLLSAYAGSVMLKATLYKVTCYLAGSIVAQYDFENPNSIVGDKVLPSVKNLIPSFNDARWSLHANAKVLGKDVLRLDATATNQINILKVAVKPNTNYIATCDTGARYSVYSKDGSTPLLTYSNAINRTFNSGSNDEINFYLSNVSTVSSFDFIKPQLYALDGKEGTIVGSPVLSKKASKRILDAKR